MTIDQTPVGKAILRVTDAADAILQQTDAPPALVDELVTAAIELGHLVMDLLRELEITDE